MYDKYEEDGESKQAFGIDSFYITYGVISNFLNIPSIILIWKIIEYSRNTINDYSFLSND